LLFYKNLQILDLSAKNKKKKLQRAKKKIFSFFIGFGIKVGMVKALCKEKEGKVSLEIIKDLSF